MHLDWTIAEPTLEPVVTHVRYCESAAHPRGSFSVVQRFAAGAWSIPCYVRFSERSSVVQHYAAPCFSGGET
jgi:hypothetical protein